MTSFNDHIAEKENTLKDVIMSSIGSLQNMNSLFTYYVSSMKPSLTVKGHTKLSSIGLLRSDRVFCAKCGNARRSQQIKSKRWFVDVEVFKIQKQ